MPIDFPSRRRVRLVLFVWLSVLLHLSVIFSPLLGRTTGAPDEKSWQGGNPSPVLRATLILPSGQVRMDARYQAPADIPAVKARTGVVRGQDPAAAEPAAGGSVGAGVLPILGTEYFPTGRLSVRPQPLGEVDLDTGETRLLSASGTMILSLWINDRGEVVDLSVEQNDLPEVFSRIAREAFRNLRFSPGELNGRRVGTVMRVEVSYEDLRETGP